MEDQEDQEVQEDAVEDQEDVAVHVIHQWEVEWEDQWVHQDGDFIIKY